jgi:hypothetical protein
MSGDVSTRRVQAVHPQIGRWVPTAVLHGLVLAVAAALCLLVLDPPLWRAIGLTLAVVGTVVPQRVPLWWLLLLLGLSQLGRQPSVTDVTFYLLLAGVHLLFVLGGLARLLPWEGRMQVGVLVRPMRRFVVVQAVVQPVAVGALLAFGGGPGTVPGLSIVAAVVLGVVAVVLVRSPEHHVVQYKD